MELPVYLFTGFLEAGKTTFIQSVLEDESFNGGETTLMLLCEDGMEELNPDTFSGHNVFTEYVERESDINPEYLSELMSAREYERVIIEYNGMWSLDTLYEGMPAGWTVVQEFLFLDARSFENYNKNMRELVVDKLKSCSLAVFNRAPKDLDKELFHKIVRATNRMTEIVYEYTDGFAEYDDIEDPLPFDIEAPVIEVSDEAYALWFRDMSEDPQKYSGKKIRINGLAVKQEQLLPDKFIFGRPLMTCCADDIQFAGLACVFADSADIPDGAWVTVEAEIKLVTAKDTNALGTYFAVDSVTVAPTPEQEIATFY